jgi:O-antigen ligase
MSLPPARIPVFAASAAFWAWCALLSYPMIADSYPIYASSQAIGLVLFLATIGLVYFDRLGPAIGSMDLAQIAILIIICLSLFLQLHDDELSTLSGIFYTSLLAAMAVTLSVLWTLEPADFERCMTVASVVLCLFGISSIAILGWPETRNIGGILQPNIFAAPLLAGFVLSQFSPGLIGIIVRILCLGMVALVSSRFATIACITALILHEMTFNPLGKAKIPVLVLALIAGIVFWPQIISTMALDDSDRGLSSGFTGRDERWHLALETIPNNPLGIGFKRAIGDEAGHNGYLRLILEFGIPGGGLLIFLLACSLAMAGIEAIRLAGKSRQQRRFDCARFGGLAALLFGAFFQPQVFSLGDAFAVSFMLLLFKPKPKSVRALEPVVRTARAPAPNVSGLGRGSIEPRSFE